MARSLSRTPSFSQLSSLTASPPPSPGAAASQGVAISSAKTGATGSAVMLKKAGEEMARSTESISWVPDLKTRYSRPENHAKEIDVAELRAMLLRNKN